MKPNPRLLAIALAALLSGHAAMGGTLFDSFSTDARPLDGRPVPQTAHSWDATKNLVLQPGHVGASVDGTGMFVASVPVPKTADQITVEAGLHVVSGIEKTSWVAVGLGQPSYNPIKGTWPEGIFVLVNTRGEFECHYNPDGEGAKLQRLKGGKVPGFTAGQVVPVRLSVDRKAFMLDISVNGTEVLTDYELANIASTLPLPFAGFSGFGQAPGTDVVTSFSLSTTP